MINRCAKAAKRWIVIASLVAANVGAAAPRSAPDQQDYYTTVDPSVSSEAQKKADELRLQTISSINSILANPKTQKVRKFELYLRLGELYGERHDYLRDIEFKNYEMSYAKWVEGGKKGKEPKLSTAKSKKEMLRAANSFRDLVREFPKHPRTDAALFSLAKTLGRLGNDNSIMYFEKIIKDHKNSTLLPDAYISMGEFYFEKNQLEKAIDAYQSALKYKNHRSYPYAVYKLGWSYYNQSTDKKADEKKFIDKSVAAFKLVIQLSNKNKAKHGVLDLKDEALRDLVMVWAEKENINDAWAYFASINQKKYFYDMLESLGNAYFDNGKHKQAINVYARLLKEAPTREQSPTVHSKLVDLYAHIGDTGSVVNEIKNMNLLYVQGSPWTIKNAQNKSVVNNGSELTEQYTHRYGTLFHQKGQKTNQKGYLSAAEEIYVVYLKTFSKHKNAYDIEFYLADVKYEFKKYEQAADHYTNVAKHDVKSGKHLKSASYNAVLALNKLDVSQKYDKLPKPGKVEKPIALPRVKKKFVEVIDNYIAWNPKEKDGYPMRFTAAQTLYDYGHYDEAIKRFSEMAEQIPETPQGKSSIQNILAHYTTNSDWVNAIAWARKLNQSPAIAKAGHGANITKILQGSLFSRAAELEKNQKYEDAAKGFLGYQSEFPKDKNADIALFNATVNFYKIGAVEQALAAGKKILDIYPKSNTVPEVLINSAQTYESLAQFDQAAKYYENFAVQFPKNTKASAALYNAALLNKGLHNFSKSIALYDLFVQRYPRNELIADAQLEVAQLMEREKNFKSASEAYAKYEKMTKSTDDKLLARAKIAEITTKHVSSKNGMPLLESLRRELSQKNSPAAFEARAIVARVYFEKLDEDFSKFKKIKIDNPDKVEKQVEAKQNALVNMADKYQKVITLSNGEYTVASLYRLGEMHEQFSHQLLHVPSGSGASQMDIDKLRSELEKLALPLKDQAYKFFEAAHQRSAEVTTLSEWTRRTYNKLSELSSEKFPEVSEIVADAEYMSHKLDMDKLVAELSE